MMPLCRRNIYPVLFTIRVTLSLCLKNTLISMNCENVNRPKGTFPPGVCPFSDEAQEPKNMNVEWIGWNESFPSA